MTSPHQFFHRVTALKVFIKIGFLIDPTQQAYEKRGCREYSRAFDPQLYIHN